MMSDKSFRCVSTSVSLTRGVARIFQGGGHTVSNNIVMAFSLRNIVGCLLKNRLTKGGHWHPRTPPATPLLTQEFAVMYKYSEVPSYWSVHLKMEFKAMTKPFLKNCQWLTQLANFKVYVKK